LLPICDVLPGNGTGLFFKKYKVRKEVSKELEERSKQTIYIAPGSTKFQVASQPRNPGLTANKVPTPLFLRPL